MEGGQVSVAVGCGTVLLSAPWSLWLVLQLWYLVLFAVVIGQRYARFRNLGVGSRKEYLAQVTCNFPFGYGQRLTPNADEGIDGEVW